MCFVYIYLHVISRPNCCLSFFVLANAHSFIVLLDMNYSKIFFFNDLFYLFSLVIIVIEIELIHQVINEHNHKAMGPIHVIHSKFCFFLWIFLFHSRIKKYTYCFLSVCVCAISKRHRSFIYAAALALSSGSHRRRM